MEIEDYQEGNGTNNQQIKRLIITGSKYPYLNKLIKIRMEFEDDYPKVPLKMYVEKTKEVPFLHANVYNDLGDICHPLLEKNQSGNCQLI
jgi:ubiquitin-protein ligase